MTSMSEKEKQQDYPVKTTHEFFSEINNEWGRFKRGAILSTIVCSILLVGFVFVFLGISKVHGFDADALVFMLLLAGFLVYIIYLMTSQYRFFRRWEERMKHTYSYEEKLLADDKTKEEDEDNQTNQSL